MILSIGWFGTFNFVCVLDKSAQWHRVQENTIDLNCFDCFTFSSTDICEHRLSDHNYYAICRVRLRIIYFGYNFIYRNLLLNIDKIEIRKCRPLYRFIDLIVAKNQRLFDSWWIFTRHTR